MLFRSSYINGKKIKFWKVQYFNEEEFCSIKNFDKQKLNNLENGAILILNDKDGLYIKAKDGIIKVLEVQGENAKRMSINEFLRGNKIELNEKFN